MPRPLTTAQGFLRKAVVVAALVCAVGWLTKMLVMVGQGGPEEGSAPESAAFIVGLVGFLILAASLAATVTGGRRVGTRVLASVLGVAAAALALGLLQLALTALPGRPWWQPEAAFLLAALAALAIAATTGGSRTRRSHHSA